MGLREHFEVVVGPDLSARTEDKTATIARALEALGDTRAVMVGDRSFDVVGAHANGIPAIGVTWGIGDAAELSGAERTIDDPSALPEAVLEPAVGSARVYDILKWLHISAAVVGLGATFALSIGFPLALRSDPRNVPFVHRLSLDINRKLASPALLVLIATGLYMAIDRDLLGEPWVGGPILIALIIGGMQGSYFVPTDKKLAAMAEKELADGATALSADYQRQAQREGGIGAFAGLLIIVGRLPDDGQTRLANGPASASALSSAAGIGRPIRKPWPKSQPLEASRL